MTLLATLDRTPPVSPAAKICIQSLGRSLECITALVSLLVVPNLSVRELYRIWGAHTRTRIPNIPKIEARLAERYQANTLRPKHLIWQVGQLGPKRQRTREKSSLVLGYQLVLRDACDRKILLFYLRGYAVREPWNCGTAWEIDQTTIVDENRRKLSLHGVRSYSAVMGPSIFARPSPVARR